MEDKLDTGDYRERPTEQPLEEIQKIQRGPVIYLGDTCIERSTGETITEAQAQDLEETEV